MARRLFLWMTAVPLISLALANGASSAALWSIRGNEWAFSTPYSQPPPLTMRIIEISGTVQAVVSPVAWISLAVYLVLLDREDRRQRNSRGFEVR